MCGRFTNTKPEKIKIPGISAKELKDAKARYNVAPSQDVLSVINASDEKHAVYLHWGLIPSWTKERQGSGIINARSETIQEKPSFRDSFKRRRCLIPADGFYEWKKTGKTKQPYYFQMKDESVFSFAGIWDVWKRDGEEIISCAIITTEPNELLGMVHNRMPVILRAGDVDAWLDEDAGGDELQDLLKPFPADYMKSYPVGLAVNNPSVDEPQLVEKVT